MGIVVKQSIQNLITTYIGFFIGAVNTLFLYIYFLSPVYFGLISFLLSTATLLMPFLAFGVHNTIIKFYSSFQGEKQNAFLQFVLLLPLMVSGVGVLICLLGYEMILSFLSSENAIVGDYLWHIVIIAIAMAYFEVFYALAKVQLKSAFGNFLKEVFHRLAISFGLIGVGLNWIDVAVFIYFLVGVYILRMLLMLGSTYKLFSFRLIRSASPTIPKSSILKYTVLIILAGSVATMLLEIDQFMIGKLVAIENVAFYAVAVYIATVIAVPARAMHQIIYPLTAQLLNSKEFVALTILYNRSSLTLLVVSGLLFLLIACNLQSLYSIINPQYAQGLYVMLTIGSLKLLDNALGASNAILFNSDYYRIVLIIGVALVFLAILLNLFFIPLIGINGAAIATFISGAAYGVAKLLIIKQKFNMMPFTINTLKLILIIIALFGAFYFWNITEFPILSILVKGIGIAILFVVMVYHFNISEDINQFLNKIFQLLTKSKIPK